MIFNMRMTLGDERVYESSKNLSTDYRSKLCGRHPAQTEGIIGGWQDKQ